jgi:hypothetical protein
MTRRVRWFVAGVGVGVLASRRMTQTSPATMVGAAASSVRARIRRLVDDVLADVRGEMQRREARLREVLAAPDARATGATARRR